MHDDIVLATKASHINLTLAAKLFHHLELVLKSNIFLNFNLVVKLSAHRIIISNLHNVINKVVAPACKRRYSALVGVCIF
jgi:hypothetical protein